jgi:TolB-like protein/Flp pilus assembly protein TadD
MIGRFIGELKRRNVIRAGMLYIGTVWVLSQGISELTGSLSLPEESTKWFLIASIIGLPFWLMASWFFEFTTSGIKRESEVIHDDEPSRRSNRRVDLIIFAVLALAVVLLLTDRLLERSSPTLPTAGQGQADTYSIAVLPFDNVSGDQEQQYFSDGLSEGFIIALSHIDGLRVINRKSSFLFRDSKEDSQDIAHKLGVSHLLEGSIWRAGEMVRISATLIQASDGSTVWAESYDRPYKDLFVLQDQIVASVAGALKSRLLPLEKEVVQTDRPPSGNLDAYNAYLQAHSATDAEAAIKLYDYAIRLDPDYGVAYAMKARILIDLVSGGLSGEQAETAFNDADAAIAEAERLATGQAVTHVAKGWLLMLRDFNWNEGEAELRQAVALSPDDGDALFQLGVARASQGDLPQAIELTQKALQLDPLDANRYRWLVAYLMPLGRLDEANQAIDKTLDIEPNAIYSHHLRSIVAVLQKDVAAAKRAAQLEPPGPWQDFALALAAQIGEDPAQADALLQYCIDHYAEGWAFQIAQVYAVRKQPDAMFKWLKRALQARDPGMQSLLYDALLLPYRAEPQYRALVSEVGLPWPENDVQASQ